MRLLSDVRSDCEARGLAPLSPGSQQPGVMYAWYKHLWATGARQEAFAGVQHLAAELGAAHAAVVAAVAAAAGAVAPLPPDPLRQLLSAKVHLKLGLWRRSLTEELSEGSIASIMANLKAATESAPAWGKAWHHWSVGRAAAGGQERVDGVGEHKWQTRSWISLLLACLLDVLCALLPLLDAKLPPTRKPLMPLPTPSPPPPPPRQGLLQLRGHGVLRAGGRGGGAAFCGASCHRVLPLHRAGAGCRWAGGGG